MAPRGLTPATVRLATGPRVPYVEQGDRRGVPLLLLHGPTDSWRSFEPLLRELPDSVRALAFSQRGHGDADRPEAGYRPADFAADAVAFMDALGLERAILLGHSGSSWTAELVAQTHPERVRGLVLIAAPHRFDNKPTEELLTSLPDPIDRHFAREFVAGTITRPLPPAFLEQLVDEACKVSAAVWRATFSELFSAQPPTDAGPLDTPALLLWGDRDELCTRADQEALLGALRRSRLVVLPGVGHSPHFEDPAACAAEIGALARGDGVL